MPIKASVAWSISASGITTINVAGSSQASTVSGVSSAVAFAVSDDAVDHTITYNDVSGSADTATVTVAGLTGGNATELTLAGIETVALTL